MSQGNADFLRTLEEQIEQYMYQFNALINRRRSIEDEISKMQECVKSAVDLLAAEQKRLGKVSGPLQAKRPPEQRFVGMLARDAIHVVLREKKRMRKLDIAKALRDGGFDFGDRSPKRVVHFALVGDPNVRMHPSGLCEWVGEENE